MTQRAGSSAKPRAIGLDILRLLAVVLVLGRHMPSPPETLPTYWASILSIWQRGGWVGVDLFFVLSGFLVSGLLFTEYKLRGHFSIVRFYTRRGWKIYPPFFFYIAATLGARASIGRTHSLPPGREIAAELLFLQSYLPGLWGHTWSLAVEEHFYLLLPLALALLLKLNRGSTSPLRPVLPIAMCVAILEFVLRLVNWWDRPAYSNLTHLYPTHLRLDSLAAGVAVSYAYHFHTSRFVSSLSPWRRQLIGAGILLLTPAFIFSLGTTPFIFTAGFTLFYMGSTLLMVGTLLSSISRNPFTALLARLGADSYSIYLWHVVVLGWGVPLAETLWGAPLSFGVGLSLYCFGSIALGVAMAKIVERPALRLRDHWFPPVDRGPIERE